MIIGESVIVNSSRQQGEGEGRLEEGFWISKFEINLGGGRDGKACPFCQFGTLLPMAY